MKFVKRSPINKYLFLARDVQYGFVSVNQAVSVMFVLWVYCCLVIGFLAFKKLFVLFACFVRRCFLVI